MTSRAAVQAIGQTAGPSGFRGNVFNVPYGQAFLKALATAVLNGELWGTAAFSTAELPGITIYLPSLNAVEELKFAFLDVAPGGATFLPRIRVLGEMEPLDAVAAFPSRGDRSAAALNLLYRATAIPSSCSALERRLDLAAYVLKVAASLKNARLAPGERLYVDMTPAAAFAAAGTVATLIGEACNDGANLDRLLPGADGLRSATATLSHQLLEGVLKAWNASKAATGTIDPEERRDRTMEIEGEAIARSDAPVVIAGSTGSVAATFGLMQRVLSRPRGALVLSGLDRTLDAESFEAIGSHPEHPQHGWHQLLLRLGIERQSVRDLGSTPNGIRVEFLSEAMRPGSTTAKWKDFAHGTSPAAAKSPAVVTPENISPFSWGLLRSGKASVAEETPDRPLQAAFREDSASAAQSADFRESGSDGFGPKAFEGLCLIEADHLQEEAEVIALLLRDALDLPGRTAALITPDENLSARVRQRMTAFGIDAPLPARDALAVAAGVARCADSGGAAEFVAFLGEAFAANPVMLRALQVVDLAALRQMWRPKRYDGLPSALERGRGAVASGRLRHPALLRIRDDEWNDAQAAIERAVNAFAPLNEIALEGKQAANWVASHRAVLLRLDAVHRAPDVVQEPSATLMERLAASKLSHAVMDLAAYAALFGAIAARDRTIREESGHPRLFMGRPLDARLLSFDVVVLGGLNEGCWPASAQPDAWLSRRERQAIGLAGAEKRVGQAAQDFEAHAASPSRTILTRSRTVDGSLARPSRWVSRMTTLAKGAGIEPALRSREPWLGWARAMRQPKAVMPCQRPAPCPPLNVRPRKMSVTALETWFANPYAIYARHILRLEPLRRASETADVRDKGILIHTALQLFFETYGVTFPANTPEALVKALDTAASEAGFDFANAPFWRPRFERFALWFAGSEAADVSAVHRLKSEAGGKYEIAAMGGPFLITARADRIDAMTGGGLRIFDFKTSPNTARLLEKRGAQQLALEGMLAQEGAFRDIAACDDLNLAYIVVGGGDPAGAILNVDAPSDAIEAARRGVFRLINKFDDPRTPYVYGTNPLFADRAAYDPYAHLARTAEWAGPAQGENGGDE